MRIAIVDDNPIDRMNLRTLLEADKRVEFVGEADCLAAAREMIKRVRPEVLFLDVELGRESGFQLLDVPERPSRVVFTTLHHHYAVDAFDAQATDYLLKPVMPARLDRTLTRLAQIGAAASAAKPSLASQPMEIEDLLVFKQGGERRVLAVGKIAWITGDRDYTRVLTADGKEYLDTRRMRDWQQILPARFFQLIDRSTIINLGEIAAYRPTPSGGRVSMRNSTVEMVIGPAAFKRLEECLDCGLAS
ncbi:MAG: LytTR family DNA-binding domain-containing protein [Rariglobus sp.]